MLLLLSLVVVNVAICAIDIIGSVDVCVIDVVNAVICAVAIIVIVDVCVIVVVSIVVVVPSFSLPFTECV